MFKDAKKGKGTVLFAGAGDPDPFRNIYPVLTGCCVVAVLAVLLLSSFLYFLVRRRGGKY